MIKRSALFLLISGISMGVFAQQEDAQQEKFESVDKLLMELARKTEKDGEITVESIQKEVGVNPGITDNMFNMLKAKIAVDGPIKINNAQPENDPNLPLVSDKGKSTPLAKSMSDNSKIPLTAVPPSSRFDFKRDTFISAYKTGLFFSGAEPLAVDSGTDIVELVATSPMQKACVLSSTKSNLSMRGSVSGGESFFEVKSISVIKYSDSKTEQLVISIDFLPKKAKTASEIEVGFSLKCKGGNLLLEDITSVTKDLFKFTVAQMIEI